MLALVASPVLKSAFDFEFLRENRADESENVARPIGNLHRILVNPNAAPGTPAAAKRMLLSVLKRTKNTQVPFMIVPPIAELRARRASKPDAAPANADPLLPSAPMAKFFPKRARASSSPSFRANLSPNRSAWSARPEPHRIAHAEPREHAEHS